jgi:hypothetical protein
MKMIGNADAAHAGFFGHLSLLHQGPRAMLLAGQERADL